MDAVRLGAPNNNTLIVLNVTAKTPTINPLVSFNLYSVFLLVNSFGFTFAIAVFGVFGNTLNIIVYLKLGLQETTNVSFFALACVDLMVSVCSCLSVVGQLSYVSSFGEVIRNLSYHLLAVMFPTLGLGAWITALLSAERCACIVMPLKVKTIVTRRRIFCLILGMAVYETVFGVLMFTIVHPPYNKPNPTRIILLLYSYSLPAFICFCLVLIFTSFIIIRLRKTLEWRTSTSTQSTKTSGVKERRVVLSVLWICIMFIVCFTPFVVIFVITLIQPRFTLWDPYFGWLVHIIYTFNYLFQTTASALNIFVYYNVSTRFREVLRSFFPCTRNYENK